MKKLLSVLRSPLEFLRTAFAELRQMTWLGPKQTLRFGGFVLLFLLISAVLVAGVDFLLFRLVLLITNAN